MTTSKKITSLTESFTSFLRGRHMRVTSERMAVVAALARIQGIFSVDSLYHETNQSEIPVSLATVYNTVDLLCAAALVTAVGMPGSPGVMYQVTGNSSVQILYICDRCGKIKEATDREVSFWLGSHSFKAFAPRAFTLSVYGLCGRCSRRPKQQ